MKCVISRNDWGMNKQDRERRKPVKTQHWRLSDGEEIWQSVGHIHLRDKEASVCIQLLPAISEADLKVRVPWHLQSVLYRVVCGS